MCRKVLKFIGCDNRAMLEVARAKLGDGIGVSDRLDHDDNMESEYGNIASLFGEFNFHGNGQFEHDGLETEDQNVECGDAPPEKIRHKIKETKARIAEEERNGLSSEGAYELSQVAETYEKCL